MIVCVCNNLNECQIIEAVQNGAGTINEVYKYWDRTTDRCCMCVDEITRTLEQYNCKQMSL